MKALFNLLLLFLLASCSKEAPVSLVKSPPRLNVNDSLAVLSIYQKMTDFKPGKDNFKTEGELKYELDTLHNEYRVVSLEISEITKDCIFPEELRQLTELRKLSFLEGTLYGSIPPWIGELKKLQSLVLMRVKLTGSIPMEITELTELKKLRIAEVELSGKLPNGLYRLSKMENLVLTQTKIGGEIPKELGQLKKLEFCILSQNQFEGMFPIEFAMSCKYIIECDNNNITELPFEIWRDDVSGFPPMLTNNRLSGKIPDWVLKTKKWKDYGFVVEQQQDGFGYVNFKR